MKGHGGVRTGRGGAGSALAAPLPGGGRSAAGPLPDDGPLSGGPAGRAGRAGPRGDVQ